MKLSSYLVKTVRFEGIRAIHIQNQEIFDNPGNSGKASTIPAEFVYPENAGMVGI